MKKAKRLCSGTKDDSETLTFALCFGISLYQKRERQKCGDTQKKVLWLDSRHWDVVCLSLQLMNALEYTHTSAMSSPANTFVLGRKPGDFCGNPKQTKS